MGHKELFPSWEQCSLR